MKKKQSFIAPALGSLAIGFAGAIVLSSCAEQIERTDTTPATPTSPPPTTTQANQSESAPTQAAQADPPAIEKSPPSNPPVATAIEQPAETKAKSAMKLQPAQAQAPSPPPERSGGRPTVVVGSSHIELDEVSGFALAAFPPTLTDQKWHQDAWTKNICLDCHETGVGDATPIRHAGLPAIVREAMCRTCHTIEPGKLLGTIEPEPTPFAFNAFPPMLPNNANHKDAWTKSKCFMCHEDGAKNAPVVKHEGMPRILLEAKCRTCHVQVRSHEAIQSDRAR